MKEILVNILPVFLIIALGYAASRTQIVSKDVAGGLSRFVFLFAIPALLFRTMLNVDVIEAMPWRLWGSYFLASAIIWICGLWISRHIRGLGEVGGSATAMSSSFSNLVLLGLPLAVSYFGDDALAPATLIVAIHAPVHWFAATLKATWSERELNHRVHTTFKELLSALCLNPVVMSIVVGLMWNFTGLGLHPIADQTIGLLGQAGVPTALFALGLSLSTFGFRGEVASVTAILLLKMVLFPLVAFLLATQIFHLSPLATAVVILFASMPPGVNPYLFATRYHASVAPVSGAIFIGTGLSIFTTVAILWALGNI